MGKTERENRVQTRAINIIRKYRGYVVKNQAGMFVEKGRPDLTACVPVTLKRCIELFGPDATIGLFVGLEIKREGLLGTVSDAQEIVGGQIKKAKGMWFAIDDSDVVEALMERLTGGTDAE